MMVYFCNVTYKAVGFSKEKTITLAIDTPAKNDNGAKVQIENLLEKVNENYKGHTDFIKSISVLYSVDNREKSVNKLLEHEKVNTGLSIENKSGLTTGKQGEKI